MKETVLEESSHFKNLNVHGTIREIIYFNKTD